MWHQLRHLSHSEQITFYSTCNRKDTAKLLPVSCAITKELEKNQGLILFIVIKVYAYLYVSG